jgi:hypothetical protein
MAAGLAGLAAMLELGVTSAAVPGSIADPATACGLLADQRLPARGAQRDGDYECHSAPQRLAIGRPLPHEIGYQAIGNHGRVAQLQLELVLRSPGEAQPAFRELARLAGLLTTRALGQTLPEDAARANAMGEPGTWPAAGAKIALERITGAEPALRFVIRFVD